ncbi:hypothetical protein GBAR_LOCUS10291, partial [Geodia barretti]
RCYVQLVSSEVEGGFQEGGCVEGEGEGVHGFPGLLPVTYTVLVYGLAAGGGVDSSGEPDYITVATVHDPQPSNQPSPTDKMTRPLVIPNGSTPWCAEGKQPCSILVVFLYRYKQELVLVYVLELLQHAFCL